MGRLPTVVSVAAPSGSGKTTLVTRLIERLSARGFRVGAIKSDAHGVELDTPGKDTHRMRASGAETTALVSSDQIAIFRDRAAPEMALIDLVETFFSELDFVLVEGFRRHGFPTLVVSRRGVDMTGWRWPEHVLALVTDEPRDDLPCLDLDDVDGVAELLCRLGSREAAPPAPGEDA